MDISELRKKLSAVMEKRNLTYKEVEAGSGLPVSSLRNFINGLVKDPRLDVIVSVADFLKIVQRMNKYRDEYNQIPLIEYKPADIVRSGLVREFITAKYELKL